MNIRKIFIQRDPVKSSKICAHYRISKRLFQGLKEVCNTAPGSLAVRAFERAGAKRAGSDRPSTVKCSSQMCPNIETEAVIQQFNSRGRVATTAFQDPVVLLARPCLGVVITN
ncbi:hypothetical protein J6590_068982 [Homalodisca vitripennis]|nr:hypothetical protein J6590_068982 [Homalodisca vitripennis]